MHQRIYSERLQCAPETVWAFLGDVRNDKAWRLEIDSVELLSGSPPLAPASYRECVRWAGLKAEVILHVTESDPASRLVIEVDGSGYSSRSAWRFEPHGDGALVTLNFTFESTTVMGMAEPVLWGLLDGWLSRDLPLLQGHLGCA